MEAEGSYIETDTIAAIASSHSPAGIAIIRVSGPLTKSIIPKIFKSKISPINKPRQVIYGEFQSATGKLLDTGMTCFMAGKKSFTGEDTAELHLHGNPLICKLVLRELFQLGVKPAAAGEFTKRAYLNGKLDLVQAEAVAELIAAQSEKALALAQEHHAGKLSNSLNQIGEPLRDLLAEIEAHIDFPEEEIEPENQKQLLERAEQIAKSVKNLLASYQYGQVVKEGFKVLLCGKPNVGKSSILNLLLGFERAIVTDISGTTRDTLEEELYIDGYKFRLCDTAGLRESDDLVEQIGVKRSREKFDWAQLILLIFSSDTTENNETVQEITALHGELKNQGKSVLLIQNKTDLKNQKSIDQLHPDLKISSHSDIGLTTLKSALVQEIKKNEHQNETSQVIVQERHRICLEKALTAIEQAIIGLKSKVSFEYLSSDLRVALQELEEIVGKTYTEDLLGRIFSKFCIGK